MVYSYRDLEVFKAGRTLAKEIYTLTSSDSFKKDYGLIDQLRRASVSIISNIAEGSGRGTRKENINFLSIAKGSCCEVQAQLLISYDIAYIDEATFNNLDSMCEEIIKMLNGLIKYMKHMNQSSSS